MVPGCHCLGKLWNLEGSALEKVHHGGGGGHDTLRFHSLASLPVPFIFFLCTDKVHSSYVLTDTLTSPSWCHVFDATVDHIPSGTVSQNSRLLSKLLFGWGILSHQLKSVEKCMNDCSTSVDSCVTCFISISQELSIWCLILDINLIKATSDTCTS